MGAVCCFDRPTDGPTDRPTRPSAQHNMAFSSAHMLTPRVCARRSCEYLWKTKVPLSACIVQGTCPLLEQQHRTIIKSHGTHMCMQSKATSTTCINKHCPRSIDHSVHIVGVLETKDAMYTGSYECKYVMGGGWEMYIQLIERVRKGTRTQRQ